MSLIDCLDSLRIARELTEDERDGLAKRYNDLAAQGFDNSAIKEMISTEMRATELHEKRTALLQRAADEEALSDVFAYRDEVGQQDPAEAFFYMHETFFEAPARDLAHGRDVIQRDAMREMSEALWEFRKGALTGDHRRTGKILGNQAVKARMENMIRELGGQSTDDAMAKRFADAWKITSERLRQRFNAAGGDIGKRDDWIMSQWHDAQALLDAGRGKWVSYMMADGVLDMEKMRHPVSGAPMTRAELQESLDFIWRQITSEGWYDPKRPLGQPQGKGALYKRRADHRFLHFKDPESWLQYQKDFGGSDPYSAMVGHISSMSRDIAAMERFGPNPERGRELLKATILQQAGNTASSRSILDELNHKLATLKKTYSDLPTRTSEIMDRIGKIDGELNVIRRKKLGNTSKRNKAKREKLLAELWDLNKEFESEMAGHGELTPDKMAVIGEVGRVMDEMATLDVSLSSRNALEVAKAKIKRADEVWKLYSGSSSTPVNSNVAGWMQGVRNWVSASILPFASLSALADQGTGLSRRAFIGMPPLKQFESFVRGFTKNDRKLALQLGIGLDQAESAMHSQARFLNTINVKDFSGYIVDRTHAFSGLSPMTQAAKVGFGIDFQSWMVGVAQKNFGELEKPILNMFKRHGFTEADFARLKTVTPDTVQRGGDLDMLTPAAIERDAGRDVSEKYLTMMLREQRLAVIEGTMRGRTLFVSESQPGSLMGEITRSAAMVKSFPISYSMLILGSLYREFMGGRGSEAAKYGAALFFSGLFFGAMARQAKNLAHGRDPEPMTSNEFWTSALMQAGGAGIYSDFLASGLNRFGQTPAATLMGPLADRFGTVKNLTIGNLVQLGQDEKTNFGREAVQFVRQNTPGAFVPFYLRTAFERMVLDEMQRVLDPTAHSSFRKKARRAKKHFGSEGFWPPGQSLPERGPDLSNVTKTQD